MKKAKGWTVVRNGSLFDGTGAAPVAQAALHIQDGLIQYAGPAAQAPTAPPDATVIDAQKGTILPGLVEAHFHATYFNVAELADLDIKYPVEYVTLLAAANAKLALECGYTAARSCGSLHNIDVWLKKAIENDLCPGTASRRRRPRDLRLGRSHGLESRLPQARHGGSDPPRQRPRRNAAAVRKLAKDGVEWVKTYPSGDAASPHADHHSLCMTREELDAAVAEAHNFKLKVTGHCRATQGIKNALLAGFDAIEHATFIDAETLDLLSAQRSGRSRPILRERPASSAERNSACPSGSSTATRKPSRAAPKARAGSSRPAAGSAWAATTASPGLLTATTRRSSPSS
jgi:imidazolonepropionase-like amidohydrolase